VFEA
jgi:hypothetical protein